MELVSITDSYEVDELPIPAEYVFRLETGEEWVVCFVPTVPYEGESPSEEIHGDLFACRAGAIVPGTRPIARGGEAEREVLIKLGAWLDRASTEDRGADSYRELAWFRRALERRRDRVEVD